MPPVQRSPWAFVVGCLVTGLLPFVGLAFALYKYDASLPPGATRLEKMVHAHAKLHIRARGGAGALGWLLFNVAIWPFMRLFVFSSGPSAIALGFFSVMPFSLVMLLLTLRGTDGAMLSVFEWLFFVIGCALSITGFGIGIRSRGASDIIRSTAYTANGVLAALCTAKILAIIVRSGTTPVRVQLLHLWSIVRVALFGCGVVSFVVVFGSRIERAHRCGAGADGALTSSSANASTFGDQQCRMPDELLPSQIAFQTSCVLATLVSTRSMRAYMTRALGRLGTRSATEQESAAAVAALIGGSKAMRAIAMAESLFRVIPLRLLTQELFMSGSSGACNHIQRRGKVASVGVESPLQPLPTRTRHAALGECDAFVTHAHCDDCKEAFDSLMEYGHPGNPEATVWFDKACLSTSDLDTSLLCLPLFVCGCRNLLVLAGPRFSTRLWCAVELFVFVQMGGTHERIFIKKFGGELSERILLDFRAVNARCVDERDRHKLLAAIESSFGVLSAFDAVIHGITRERDLDRRVQRRVERHAELAPADGGQRGLTPPPLSA